VGKSLPVKSVPSEGFAWRRDTHGVLKIINVTVTAYKAPFIAASF
jgi:hypothetical protein